MNIANFHFPILPEPSDNDWYSLTEKEGKVISLVIQGKISREIGEELKMSSRTVEAYKVKICEKLKASNISNAIAIFCVEYFSRTIWTTISNKQVI